MTPSLATGNANCGHDENEDTEYKDGAEVVNVFE
jgi:hypothetical protein